MFLRQFIIIMMFIYLSTVQFGLYAFSWGKVSLTLFIVVHVYVGRKLLNLSKGYFWKAIKSPVFSSIIMGGIIFYLQSLLSPFQENNFIDIIKLILLIISGVIVYVASLYYIDDKLIKRFFLLIRKFALN